MAGELPSEPNAVDLTKASAIQLMGIGVSFAVGGNGQVLRYPDGMPIEGDRIEEMVASSGYRLTNAQAAERLVASQAFVEGVSEGLATLRADEDKKALKNSNLAHLNDVIT